MKRTLRSIAAAALILGMSENYYSGPQPRRIVESADAYKPPVYGPTNRNRQSFKAVANRRRKK